MRKRPTAAADLAVPDTGLIHEDLEFYRKEMMRSLELLVEKKKRRMALCSMENFERDIRGRIAMEQMRIDHMAEQMKQQLLAKEENAAAGWSFCGKPWKPLIRTGSCRKGIRS